MFLLFETLKSCDPILIVTGFIWGITNSQKIDQNKTLH